MKKSFILFITIFLFMPHHANALWGSIERAVTKGIKKELYDRNISYKKIVNVATEGVGGRSGDLTFFVKDKFNRNIMAIKAFITDDRDMRFKYECRALRLFKSFDLTLSEPVSIIFTKSGKEYHLLGMSIAPGKSIYMMVQELRELKRGTKKHQTLFLRICDSMRLVGRALKELHEVQKNERLAISEIEMKRHRDFLKEFFAVATPEFYKFWSRDKLSDYYLKACDALANSPGCATYVHGDANPGNIFISNSGNKVTFIDMCCAIRFVDEENNPIGFPAHDASHFVIGVELVVPQLFSSDQLQLLEDAFYSSYKGDCTAQARTFFDLYWTLRRIAASCDMMNRSSKNASEYSMWGNQVKRFAQQISFKENEEG